MSKTAPAVDPMTDVEKYSILPTDKTRSLWNPIGFSITAENVRMDALIERRVGQDDPPGDGYIDWHKGDFRTVK